MKNTAKWSAISMKRIKLQKRMTFSLFVEVFRDGQVRVDSDL